MAGVTLVQDLSSASWQLLARFAGRFDVHRLQKERSQLTAERGWLLVYEQHRHASPIVARRRRCAVGRILGQ